MALVRRPWRALAVFWIVILVVAVGAAGALIWSGAPPQRTAAARPPAKNPAESTATAAPAHAEGPRVAILVSGIGLSRADSEAAIHDLPPAVGLAVSAYAANAVPLLEAARAQGHEILISIPMEPEGYPVNDEGPDQLLTGASPVANQQHLEKVLGRVPGAIGATGASDGQRGERFAAIGPDLHGMETVIAKHRLFYIDPRLGQPSPTVVPGRSVDVDLDGSPSEPDLDKQLAALAQQARTKGVALGLLGLPHARSVEQLAAWTKSLQAKGLTLVPVSTIVQSPPAGRQAVSK